MTRKTAIAVVLSVAFGAAAYGGFRHLRGPTGGSVAFGGSLEATQVPEFTSPDASSWVNGAPAMLGSLRGAPVLLEIWSPH